jgi:tetratricopeptide (TPR) repeat protein
MRINLCISIIATGVLLSSCNSTKSLYSEAAQYEDAAMYTQALDRYEEIYQSKRGEVEAHISMKRVAQLLLEKELAEVRTLQMKGAYEDALDKLDAATAIQKKYEFLELQTPAIYNGLQGQIKSSWVNDLYSTAEDLVMREQYEEAETYINKIYRLDRNNEKAAYLDLMAQLYPNYNKGKKAHDLGLYREAYSFMKTVTDIDVDFKDAMKIMDESKSKSSFTVAYVPFHRNGLDRSLEVSLATHIKQEILSSESPFVRLLERENIDRLIEEQKNNMSAAFSEDRAVEAGKLEGAQYVLTGEFLKYSNNLSKRYQEEKRGYTGKTMFSNKVRYTEYARERTIDASFKYQLIDVETGEIHASGNIPIEEHDRVNYAVYDGDPDNLYAGNWKSRIVGSRIDEVYNSDEEKAALDAKLSGRTKNKSELQMEHEMIDFIACEIAAKVVDFSPLD